MGNRHEWTALSIISIWIAVTFASIFSNDLVAGSDPVRIPVAAITCWFWGAVATGFVFIVVLRRKPTNIWLTLSIFGIWASVALTSIFSPDLVAGSDPTNVPVAAIISPMAGAIATGFLFIVELGRKSNNPWLSSSILAIWLAVALVSIFAPELEAGSDPTILPLAAVISSPIGAGASGFVCVFSWVLGRAGD